MTSFASSSASSAPTITVPSTEDDEYPPRAVELSDEDERTLLAVANQTVSETLEASEAFEVAGRHVDSHRWKLVKARENLQVFRARRRHHRPVRDPDSESYYPERPQLYSVSEDALRAFFIDEWIENHSGTDTFSSQSSSPASSSESSHSNRRSADSRGLRRTRSLYDDKSVLEAAKPARVPLVLGTGLIEGSIDDAAFGALASTEQMWQMRDQGNRDVPLEQARILAQIHGPTREDPFRFMAIKWSARTRMQPLLRQRDFLAVESSGMAVDATGQRVFYYLTHSVDLSQVPEFTDRGVVRAKLSLCYIARPASRDDPSGLTSVYCQGFLDGGGKLVAQLAAALLGAAISSVGNVIEVSYAKKLAWLVATEVKEQSSSSSSSAVSSSRSAAVCACCLKRFASLMNPFGARVRCSLCQQVRHDRMSIRVTELV